MGLKQQEAIEANKYWAYGKTTDFFINADGRIMKLTDEEWSEYSNGVTLDTIYSRRTK